ncbi:hypothetical protein ACJX0J_020290, partial [Zea mays]
MFRRTMEITATGLNKFPRTRIQAAVIQRAREAQYDTRSNCDEGLHVKGLVQLALGIKWHRTNVFGKIQGDQSTGTTKYYQVSFIKYEKVKPNNFKCQFYFLAFLFFSSRWSLGI